MQQMDQESRRPGVFITMPHQLMNHGTRPTTSPSPAATAGGRPRRLITAPHEFYDGSIMATRSVEASASAVAGLPQTTVARWQEVFNFLLPQQTRPTTNPSPAAARASLSAVARLPQTRVAFMMPHQMYQDGGPASCAVCLEAYAAGDALRTMPCGHDFHDGCIVGWLAVSCFCPLCRFRLPTQQAEEDARQLLYAWRRS